MSSNFVDTRKASHNRTNRKKASMENDDNGNSKSKQAQQRRCDQKQQTKKQRLKVKVFLLFMGDVIAASRRDFFYVFGVDQFYVVAVGCCFQTSGIED